MSKNISDKQVLDNSQGNLTDSIKIEFELIPEHVRDDLAKATLEAVQKFISQAGGRRYLNQKKQRFNDSFII